MTLFTKWNNYTSTPRKKYQNQQQQKERSSTPTRNKFRSKTRTKIMSKKDIFRNQSKSM